MGLAAVGAEDAVAPPGGTGEIRVSGPAVFRGYLDAAETTPFDGSGRLRTGDLGYLDEAGELVVRGRAAYAIRIRGRWVCAEELEAAAREHPAISEAAAVPRGESFALLLEARNATEPLLRDVRSFLARRLPSFARPKRLVWRREIPRGPGGKVDRAAAARSIEAR
jgi:acyl-CoA synthetase (AMP-forming)/AMP-acid ligase II